MHYIGVFLGGILPLLIYNFYFFHSAIGGYGTALRFFSIRQIVQSILGILVSPARGALWYAPLTLIAVSVPFFPRQCTSLSHERKTFFTFHWLCVILALALNSLWGNYWWGGWSWSGRLLTDVVVSSAILCYLLYTVQKSFLFKTVFFTALLCSFTIQLIGVFFYPRGYFDEYPTNIDQDTARLWNIQDNPITRNLAVGPELLGLYRLYYKIQGIPSVSYTLRERACSMNLINYDSFLDYNSVEMDVKNESQVDWVTAGNNMINIRQVFFKNGQIVTESPIPTTPLPPIVQSGQVVRVRAIIIPPQQPWDTVVLAPVQEDIAWWTSSCNIQIDAKGT